MVLDNQYNVYIDVQKFDVRIPKTIAVDLAIGKDKTGYWYKGMKWDLYYRKNVDSQGLE